MNRFNIYFRSLIIAGLALTGAHTAHAKFPDKQVTIVVPYPPGGVTDVYGRAIAAELSKQWGQTVVVDNKPGGGTVIGTQLVARAPANGLTLLLTSYGFTSNPVLKKSLPYDPKSLSPLYLLGRSTSLLVVNPNVPFKNVKEMIAFGKSKPGGLIFGSSGNASSPHIAAELFAAEAGVRITHVPYKGTSPAMNDLLGGQIMGIFDGPSAMPRVNSGQLNAIAISSDKRHPSAPDVPTFRELGVDVVFGSWFGFLVPTETPSSIQNDLIQGIETAMKTTNVLNAINQTGLFIDGLKPVEFAKFLAAEELKLRNLLKVEGVSIALE
jgi:tripartite-type tricarboxylate transporter receptor subunit TctC